MEDIKIKVPEGYEIDKEKSIINLEKNIVDIKLKRKVKRWRDDQDAKIGGFWIDCESNIRNYLSDHYNTSINYNIFTTEKQAKSALAMARISQIMANDERFGGIVTDEEWKNTSILKFTLERYRGDIHGYAYYDTYQFLSFHTVEQRNLFLKENEDLVKDYLMID